MGIFVCVACCVGLACFFVAKANRESVSFPSNGTGLNKHIEVAVVSRGSETSSDTLRDHEKINDGSHTGYPGSEVSSLEQCAASSDLDENAETEDQADDEKADTEEIATRKEKFIQGRFGAICRQDKWIPTVGGGTNLVYITTGSLSPGRVGEIYNVQFQAVSGFPP